MTELHPPIVHFAIALTMMGVIFEILGFISNRESLKHAGFWTFLFGVIAVWGAMLTGHVAEESVENFLTEDAKKILETHEELGNVLPFIFTILGGLRLYLWFKENKKLYYLFLIAGLISIGLVGFQGKLGGTLVYEHLVKLDKIQKPVE
ncbi:DUF2231 domain-containing protein [Sulfurihydrogenibium azorense]|jgi:uncharacterized membrane protein|uniref:DUF2231 domain-containing protein n=1 Tax=Sulfurihydrogenibium azorense (strain DSM 15241 / OCM 825 / Az-Fu1) TaxID=204536 RepID=C1DWN3_SULAA|nr:DUF2231 domain-containing protein [Sulfurihydrogenibium azorense]ACN99167.1 conserved hypothetical protein [Sulfurihydrogenibium azorense Az-Fu1]